MKIKNLEQAAVRIQQAVEQKERIILYGDSDMDGIASVVILEEAIKNLGGEVFMALFPNRENDGYGINVRALELLKDKAPALFITLDLGIANVKEVATANEMRFEVIVVDHHQQLDVLPPAKIIVDPQQKGDDSDFEYLCNAGLAFKLIEELLKDSFSRSLKDSFLELVALATIADMMPQIGENKIFIEQGLKSLPKTFRPGLRAFVNMMGEGEVASGGFGKIISALNSAESIDFKNEAYELLTTSSKETCWEISENLLSKLQLKHQMIKQITEEVERRIKKKPNETIVFEGDPAWRLVLAGPVASVIASKYGKPTFIFKRDGEQSYGSVRALQEGQNSVEAMKSCADILLTYGGHPKASGFRIKTEDLEQFKQRLTEYFKK